MVMFGGVVCCCVLFVVVVCFCCCLLSAAAAVGCVWFVVCGLLTVVLRSVFVACCLLCGVFV